MTLPDDPLGPLKRRDGEPAFDEAWQAQALGIAELLVKAGTVSADAFATRLGSELDRSAEAGRPDTAETYYEAVLAAVQAVLFEAGAAARDEVETCEAAWRRAYAATPHGRPVELG